MVIWEKYVRKYIWDDQSTPFLVKVKDLSQAQASKELFLFAIFLATPFSLLSAATGTMVVQNGQFIYAPWVFHCERLSIKAAPAGSRDHDHRNPVLLTIYVSDCCDCQRLSRPETQP